MASARKTLGSPKRSASPALRPGGVDTGGKASAGASHRLHVAGGEELGCFRHGVRQAGWLWKRFGSGHTSKWHHLWVSQWHKRMQECRSYPRSTVLGGKRLHL